MPRWHVSFSRTCVFPRKKKSCATPEAHGLLAPKPDHPKNMVLVLMGPLVAPNRVLTGSPGRESRGGADYRVGVGPNIQKWTEIFGDPAGSGRVWAGFSGLFPEWSGMVREGPWTIIWGVRGLGGGFIVLRGVYCLQVGVSHVSGGKEGVGWGIIVHGRCRFFYACRNEKVQQERHGGIYKYKGKKPLR